MIHNFGRAENVDRRALARLVSSISRFLTPEQAMSAAAGAEVEVLDSRHLGGAWTLDRVWERLGIGAAIRRVGAGRRLDGEAVERVVFALVAQRALEPGSKLAGTTWVAERVAIEGCAGFSDDAAYAAMDFLLEALDEIAAEIFSSVAHLLNLDLDIIFVDTTSTYWEVDGADELADLQDNVDDDGITRPVENAARAFGHSKDHRTDLPQVVIAMAVTRDGVPVRCWTFPGNTNDTSIIRTVKDDLAGWNLHRMVWVADRGFASPLPHQARPFHRADEAVLATTCEHASELSRTPDPERGLFVFLRALADEARSRTTVLSLLPAQISDLAIATPTEIFTDAVATLLSQAQASGTVRRDVTTSAVLALVTALTHTSVSGPTSTFSSSSSTVYGHRPQSNPDARIREHPPTPRLG